MYLVDTCIISEARRGSKPAAAWLRSVNPSSIFLSAMTLGELMREIATSRKADPIAATEFEEWLKTLQTDHADQILPITVAITMEWGRNSARSARGDAAGLIAATAIVHDLILVTRDAADFEDTRASTINPWDL